MTDAAIDRMHLLKTIYSEYFHPPGYFSDDDIPQHPTLGGMRKHLESEIREIEAHLKTVAGKEKREFESDRDFALLDLENVEWAIRDYSPNHRFETMADRPQSESPF
jgi:hypothetical protein